MTWKSLKKFCDENFSDVKFKSDDARKKFLGKKGITIQRDDQGRDGVAVAKDGDSDTKEIRVGKRLSATKVKSMEYSDEAEARSSMAAQHDKHIAKLNVHMNSKD